MTERLQKILSACGIASRRAAEQMIRDGRVTVNARVAELGDCADPDTDTIALDGKPLPPCAAHRYIMLHKPRGYVTTLSDEKGRKTVAELVADCGQRVYPVGRLDMDSEGLLLLTSDGEFANRMMHPKHEIDKLYRTTVDGFSPDAAERLKQPITLDGYTIRPPLVRIVSARDGRAVLEIVIHEGRNRQVRRMCDAAGMRVLRLKRIGEGTLRLGTLPCGKWRDLTAAEVAALKGESLCNTM